ncbi:MAG TPA: hypothetical protein VMG58_15305, partial [Candidatus Sulfotelmatobacter sp.]|nr:hypothetical protein [Candidatus Sulfotelmatobacter sp.]
TAVQLVGLSATVSNVQEIAAWISEVHRPINAIYHPVRPVPLEFLLCHPDAEIAPLAAPRRVRRPSAPVRLRGARPGRGPRAMEFQGRRRPPSPGRVIPQLAERHWLPAIYFIFSRAGCERALERFLEHGGSLLEAERRPEVEDAIRRTLDEYPNIAPETQVNTLLLTGLRRGAGMHHAGILPALKRLTETLFERGLVRVVFATETMSLGIHMPAKSVVLQGLRKRSESGFRRLSLNELTQMAGRAGRRGIDPEGKCVIALDAPEAEEEARQLLAGQPEPIQSRFRVSYSSAALLVDLYREPAAVRRIIESSFGQFQNRRRIAQIEAERAELLARLSRAAGLESPCCALADLMAYREQRAALEVERERIRRSMAGTGKRARGSLADSPWVEGRHEGRQRVAARALALSQIPCHRCPHRVERERRLKRSDRVRQALEDRGLAQRRLTESYWEQFLRVIAVLEGYDCLAGSELRPMGRLIATLRHDNELLVARAAFSGLLDELTPPETAALLSCLVEEPRLTEGESLRPLLKRLPHLRRRLQAFEALAADTEKAQRLRGVDRPVAMHTTFLAATYEWTGGENDWVGLVQGTYGGHEGDLIRAFRRLIDLSRQLSDSPELPARLRATLEQGVRMLDRGIVLESALI